MATAHIPVQYDRDTILVIKGNPVHGIYNTNMFIVQYGDLCFDQLGLLWAIRSLSTECLRHSIERMKPKFHMGRYLPYCKLCQNHFF